VGTMDDLPDADWAPSPPRRSKHGQASSSSDEDGDEDFAAGEWDSGTHAGGGRAYQPTKHMLAALESKAGCSHALLRPFRRLTCSPQIKLDMLAQERTMPNHVMGTLKRHNVQEDERREKVKDKSDRATTEQVLDDRTRLVIFKLLKGNFFSEVRFAHGS
jgi:hypothetical protein